MKILQKIIVQNPCCEDMDTGLKAELVYPLVDAHGKVVMQICNENDSMHIEKCPWCGEDLKAIAVHKNIELEIEN